MESSSIRVLSRGKQPAEMFAVNLLQVATFDSKGIESLGSLCRLVCEKSSGRSLLNPGLSHILPLLQLIVDLSC